MHLLIIEDEEPMLAFLRSGFETEHYSVEAIQDALRGEAIAAAGLCDLAILDVNLPDSDAIEALSRLRAANRALPVIVLSSRREVEDRVRVLDMGADDCISRPFAFSELAARVRALLRRAREGHDPVLRVEDLELHRMERRVSRGERQIELTPKELALLEYLMQNAGRCVTRAMIIEHVWKLSPDTISNVVDVYINYLRKKIDEHSPLRLIHTLRGSGYVIGPAQQRPLHAAASPAMFRQGAKECSEGV
ncbi:MAG: response regulator transcription factor [Acidobacteriota bacterium]|nr:response regulator transcription factor [Acidobacteriota bacterium]